MKKQRSFLIILLFTTVLLTGCTENSSSFQSQSYTTDTAQIQAIKLDVRDRAIEVSVSSGRQIQIDYTESEKETLDISMNDDHTLLVTAKTNKDWSDYIGTNTAGRQTINLTIPDGLLNALSLSTTNEDITLSTLSVTGSVSLSANNGNLHFENLDVGEKLCLNAKNGNISGSLIGGYDDYAISCKVKKGKSNLPAQKDGGTKVLDVSNNNGNVDIQLGIK